MPRTQPSAGTTPILMFAFDESGIARHIAIMHSKSKRTSKYLPECCNKYATFITRRGNENMAKMTLPHHTNFRDKIEGGAPFSFSRDFLKRPTTTTSRKVVQFRAVGALLLLSHFEVRKSKSTLPNDTCTTASCIIVHPCAVHRFLRKVAFCRFCHVRRTSNYRAEEKSGP